MNNQVAAVHKSVIYKYSSIRYQNQITGPEFIQPDILSLRHDNDDHVDDNDEDDDDDDEDDDDDDSHDDDNEDDDDDSNDDDRSNNKAKRRVKVRPLPVTDIFTHGIIFVQPLSYVFWTNNQQSLIWELIII